MARARLIKPSFFTNDDLAELSMAARLLFAGLWTIADREGRLEDRPKRIKAEVMPFDGVNVDRLLSDLAGRGFIARYESENLRLIQIVSFLRHQSPHPKEPASRFPAMGEPMTSNRQDSDEPIEKPEPIQSARGTLADPVLPIPIAGSCELPLARPSKGITDSYLKELQPKHPTVDVREVYEDARNRKVWDGYKDKRRALGKYIGWAEEKAAQPVRGGNGNGKPRVHSDANDPEKYAREVETVLRHAGS